MLVAAVARGPGRRIRGQRQPRRLTRSCRRPTPRGRRRRGDRVAAVGAVDGRQPRREAHAEVVAPDDGDAGLADEADAARERELHPRPPKTACAGARASFPRAPRRFPSARAICGSTSSATSRYSGARRLGSCRAFLCPATLSLTAGELRHHSEGAQRTGRSIGCSLLKKVWPSARRSVTAAHETLTPSEEDPG